MSVQLNSESVPGRELQPVAATTETATGTAQPETAENPSTGTAPLSELERLAAKLEAARSECERLSRIKFDADAAADKRLRQVQLEYGKRIAQLEQDTVAERQTNESLSQKIQSLETSLDEQTKGMQKIKQQLSEPEAMLDKTLTEIQLLEQKYNALESEAAGLRQEREQLQGELVSSQTTQQNAVSQLAELTTRLQHNSRDLADLDKERTASKLSQQKAEELNLQVEKFRNAAEQAELRARESAAQSTDWEKKAADLKKAIDELNRTRVDEQSASTQSAQRLKELELQLKGANDNLAASRAETEKQNSARQRLDSENQSLTEANAKAKTDLKKAIDELNQTRVNEQGASAQSALRLKELEQQLKGANDSLAAGKADLEKQSSARQRLESENRSLTEANAKAKADLDQERDSNKTTRQEAEELKAQFRKLQQAAEQAEARARESAIRCGDWEKKAADREKTIAELTRTQTANQSAGAQSAQRIKELEQQLKLANDNLATGRADLEKQNSARQRLEGENRNLSEANAKAKADVDKERAASKLSQQKAEDLNLQVEKFRNAAEQAELRVRESAVQSKDWEKKAADLKKAFDELNQIRVSEQSTGAQSAQRLKEREQQLKGANDNLAATRADLEKQTSARQKLESDSRSLTEANAKAKADVDKERGANNALRQETEKLTAQLKKLQHDTEQAETRARESAAQSKDWEKKAIDLKKAIDELNAVRVSEQSASAQSLKHLKELEQQLKGANENLATSQAETKKQDSARQQLETENRKLAEANAKARADLDKERDANKLSRQAAQELNTELKKAQRAAEQAEARFQKGAALGSEWQEKAAELKKANSQLDAELVRLRAIEKNAQHEEYLMVDSLRRGLRQQIEELRQSAGGLLEIQLPEKQKRLAETILRHALFLQVFLNASGKNAGEKFPS